MKIKVFLNLISVKSGGQIVRAQKFIALASLAESNIELHIVKLDGIFDELNLNKNIFVYNINLGNRMHFFNRLIWENFYMSKLIESIGANVFLSFSHYLPFKKLKIPSILGISNLAPFVTLGSEDESWFFRVKFKILKKSINYSLAKSDLILALSLTAQKKLLELDYDENKILYCPIGVEPDWHIGVQDSSLLDKYNIKNKFFLYVSHFYGYKNHKRLINAYTNLPRNIRNEYKLVLVGRAMNKSYYSKVIDLIVKYRLNNNVIVIDGLERESLKLFYQKCELFIFPSLVENCPNSLLEAMASGSPIIASNIEPMTEYCLDAAIYFDPRNEWSIRNAILQYINNDHFKEMRHLSRERSKSFTWEDFTSLLVQAIIKLHKE